MSIDFKNETSIKSVKQPLEMMKVFGGKLKTNQLRMITIKDKLQILQIQIEKVEEQKVAPVEQVVDEQPKTAYSAVEDDAID